MASVVISLTALAVYKLLHSRKKKPAITTIPEDVNDHGILSPMVTKRIDEAFPAEIQSQIVADFQGILMIYCTSKYDKSVTALNDNVNQKLSNVVDVMDLDDIEKKTANSLPTDASKECVDVKKSTESVINSSIILDADENFNEIMSPDIAHNDESDSYPYPDTNSSPNSTPSLSESSTPFSSPSSSTFSSPLKSPSTNAPELSTSWDPHPVKVEATRSLLLLWSIIEDLKKTNMSVLNNPRNTDHDSHERHSAAMQVQDMVEKHLLVDFDVDVLLCILNILQIVENNLALIVLASGDFETTANISQSSIKMNPFILHKISLGWGFVGMTVNASSKDEVQKIIQGMGLELWESTCDGFLVNNIVDIIIEKGGANDIALLK